MLIQILYAYELSAVSLNGRQVQGFMAFKAEGNLSLSLMPDA